MMAIHIDTNHIAMEPMKNRTEMQIITAYQKIVDKLKAAGMSMNMFILDNECSEAFNNVIKENDMEYELVSTADQQRNITERAIQTVKNHFISIIYGVDKCFQSTCGADY